MNEVNLPSVELVVFDLGGTTVELTIDIAQALREAFNTHGVWLSEDRIVQYRGASKRDAIAQLLRTMDVQHVDPSHIHDTFENRLLHDLTDGALSPISGVEITFAALQSSAVRVVLTTGFSARVTRYLLERLGWVDRIDGVVTADDVTAGRPAPDIILRSIDLVTVRAKNRVVVVGDTANDIKAGRAAEVGAVVGVLTGAHDRARLIEAGATAILPSAAHLPAWLRLSTA